MAITNLPPHTGDHSPWGRVQRATPMGLEAVLVETASHGGFWMRPSAYFRLPEALRDTWAGGNWFEEDCDWAIPYLALDLWHIDEAETPGRGQEAREAARRTLAGGSRKLTVAQLDALQRVAVRA